MRKNVIGASLLLLAATLPAHAIPVTWNMDGVITNSRTLGYFGSPELGDQFRAEMIVETDTPDVSPFSGNAGFFNLFDSFSLSIGTSVLTLGPDSDDPGFAREANSLVTLHESTAIVQMNVLLYEGATPFHATFFFDFADPTVFPDGMLPLQPPSLESATLREFNIYEPVNGDPRNGEIFLATGSIDSFTANAISVSEPGTLGMFVAALAMLGLGRRRAGLARA